MESASIRPDAPPLTGLEMRYEIAMTNKRGAVVLGASGSVGKAVIAALVRDGTLAPIVSLVRQ